MTKSVRVDAHRLVAGEQLDAAVGEQLDRPARDASMPKTSSGASSGVTTTRSAVDPSLRQMVGRQERELVQREQPPGPGGRGEDESMREAALEIVDGAHEVAA